MFEGEGKEKSVLLMLRKQMETVDSFPTGANRNESWRGEGKCQHGESLESKEEKQKAMRCSQMKST